MFSTNPAQCIKGDQGYLNLNDDKHPQEHPKVDQGKMTEVGTCDKFRGLRLLALDDGSQPKLFKY